MQNEPVVRKSLEAVGLAELLQRYKLDDVEDWSSVLSGGQKQRLIFARLFYHSPRVALLDEATSAIATGGMISLSKKPRCGITLVTISHSSAVDAHHTQAIDLRKGGAWNLKNWKLQCDHHCYHSFYSYSLYTASYVIK